MHLGQQRRFGMEEGYFVFDGFILCFVLPAVKLLQPPITLKSCVLGS